MKQLEFTAIKGRKLTASFEEERISSDFGSILLGEVEQSIGIIDKIVSCINDKRASTRIRHTLHQILKQRCLQICCGYEDGNDSNFLRNDPAFMISSGKAPDDSFGLASQPTMCRLENSINKTDNLRIFYALIDIYLDSFEVKPKFIQLDMDPTDNICHGMQQLSLFNGYYEERCYLPFHVYDGTDGRLISTFLRAGKTPTGKEIVSVLSRIVKRIRQRWDDIPIIFRADTHHSSKTVLQYLEGENVQYIIGKSSSEPLKKLFNFAYKQALLKYKKFGKPIKVYASSYYTAKGWNDKSRRIICCIEVNSHKIKYRFIITSFEEASAKYLYETAYCGRGRAELMIKDHKNALKSDRSSCSSAVANQFRLYIHSAAYVIMHNLRKTVLRGTDLEKAQFDTIRLKILKLAVRVKVMKTKIHCFLQKDYKYANVYSDICNVYTAMNSS
jgi:hypothetical protein